MTKAIGTATASTDGADGTALSRFRVLRPVLEAGVSITAVSAESGTPVSTLRRWLRLYRCHGLTGLHRRSRSDRGRRHFPPQLTSFIEGLALQKPRQSAAAIHRVARETAQQQGWPEPSYATVHAVLRYILRRATDMQTAVDHQVRGAGTRSAPKDRAENREREAGKKALKTL